MGIFNKFKESSGGLCPLCGRELGLVDTDDEEVSNKIVKRGKCEGCNTSLKANFKLDSVSIEVDSFGKFSNHSNGNYSSDPLNDLEVEFNTRVLKKVENKQIEDFEVSKIATELAYGLENDVVLKIASDNEGFLDKNDGEGPISQIAINIGEYLEGEVIEEFSSSRGFIVIY